MSRTHKSPDPNSGIMPCCGKTPFEVPKEDRLTSNPDLATCAGEKREIIDRQWHIEAHKADDDAGYWWHIGDNMTDRTMAVFFRDKVLRASPQMKRHKFRLVRMEEIKTIEEED